MPDDQEQLGFRGHPRNIQYTTKVARLLNQTESGIARAVSDESEKFLERQYGRLIVVLDLSFTSDFYDIGEVLIDTAEREFYADLNRSVADSFEHMVTQVNQTLADLAAEGQNDWVGKLGAVIAVLHENELHITQVGKAAAYMVRGPSVTNITKGLSGDSRAATAKTFLNIATGSLEVGDKLLFSTAELFNHISEQDLRRYLYLHPPPRAIRKLADQLTANGLPDHLAIVVVELTTIDLISAETITDDPDEIVLAAPRRHFEALARFKPLRRATLVAETSARAKKYYDKRLKPALGRQTAAVRHRLLSWVARRRGEAPPPPPPRAAAGTPEQDAAPVRKPAGSEQARRAANRSVAVAGQLGTRIGRALADLLRPLGRRISTLWERSGITRTPAWRRLSAAGRRIRALYRRSPISASGNRRTLYRNLLIVIALVFVFSLIMSTRAAAAKKHEAAVRDQIKQVQAGQAKAEASFIFKDVAGARTQLTEAERDAEKLDQEKTLRGDINNLKQSLAQSADRINNVVHLPDQPTADFNSLHPAVELTHLAQAGTTLYAIGDSGQLYSVPQGSADVKLASASPNLIGKVRSTAVTGAGTLLIFTDKPTLFEHDAKAGSTAEIPVTAGGGWEPGVAIDTIQQAAFVLDPSKNQIWRHTRSLSEYGKGEPYVTADTDLKSGVDLATGAQVYVLKSDGSVLQFTGGAPQPFKLNPPPGQEDKLNGASALGVNYVTGLVYVADPGNQRIVEFNNKGEYVRQFKNNAFGGTRDVLVDDKTNTLFVITGSKLYQLGLGT